MAGHSKWKNIQARKSVQDKKKGKVFTKVTKEIMLAAKQGGGDPDINARLRSAIAAAKAVNLPKDKIDTALKKGTGELGGEALDEITYEGYGPGGVAILVDAATDNRNRTVADIRHIFSKNGGNLGESGCVAWMFDKKGLISFDKASYTEEQLLEAGLEAGVEDIRDDGEMWEVSTTQENFQAVLDAYAAAGFSAQNEEVTMVPQTLVPVDEEAGRKIIRLMEALEDYDDVQDVYVNCDFPEELMQDE
ncbi:DNA-binding regulatory protein, YebC/PmpR family [Desulfonatronum thiosulfatophilum]|uniref:Probable transcriptional regulatory protein SAMN05660653_00097 n=1 Tax=Desulfonatronum thiosulfatophilum TaxID=617002 RepID=A0A1G6A2N5_9BACT|nr:YebC/PmpR family DNA-binding transcriptional regulator [Desulfonatronum thiosulfatophilum]SDB02610.1 DNA-binding regulatory protein, YebC/PmpR family [Desulfonatronum thiosulfatophilum]